MKENFSRRSFLKGASAAALLGASAAVVGCESAPASYASTLTWDVETEVLVVGYGGSGVVSTVEAFDNGAQVLIIEKAVAEGGGVSRMSNGNICYATDDAAVDFLMEMTKGTTPRPLFEAWVKESYEIQDWLDDHNISFDMRAGMGADLDGVPGSEALETIFMCDPDEKAAGIGGSILFEWANKFMADNGIEIKFDTAAQSLIQDPNTKEILGVTAATEGGSKTINIRAKKAVILCTGGFETNPDMMASFVRPAPMVSSTSSLSTGDGIKMAQEVGADLWHMGLVCSHGPSFAPKGSSHAYWANRMAFPNATNGKNPSWFLINRTGKRFEREVPQSPLVGHRSFMSWSSWNNEALGTSSEMTEGNTTLMTKVNYRDIPAFFVWDQKEMDKGCLVQTHAGPQSIPVEAGGLRPWSEDNSQELADGWILQADTMEELYDKIMADAVDDDYQFTLETFMETVNTFNTQAAAGTGDSFGRTAEYMTALDTPPYYAMRTLPSTYTTTGGPVKNEKGQILNVRGEAIPRLYEAGILGSTSNHVYSLFGQNWSEVMFFGRISGRNAAAEAVAE